jgi:hypothetical protein
MIGTITCAKKPAPISRAMQVSCKFRGRDEVDRRPRHGGTAVHPKSETRLVFADLLCPYLHSILRWYIHCGTFHLRPAFL